MTFWLYDYMGFPERNSTGRIRSRHAFYRWAHRKKPPLVHEGGKPWPTRVHGVWVCLVPPAFITLYSQIFKDPLPPLPAPHDSPSSKSSTFWLQHNLLGLAWLKQNLNHCWNRVMAHRGLFTSFYLGEISPVWHFLEQKVGWGWLKDKPYNPSHLTALLFQGLTASYLFSLPGAFPTSPWLIRILLDQGSPQNHLLHEADPEASAWMSFSFLLSL